MNKHINIKELVPSFAEDFIDLENEIFERIQYDELIAKNHRKIGLLNKYINGKLHDSWILNSKLTNETYQLELNDFATHVFSDAIIEKKNLRYEDEDLIFPIEINFHKVKKIQFYTINEKGFAMPIQITKIDEYLYEQILAISENSIEIAFQFWKNAESELNPGQRLVAIVGCESIELKEHQDEYWNKLFGNEYDEYYQYFKDQLNSGRYVSDLTECLKLIEEYEKQNKMPNA